MKTFLILCVLASLPYVSPYVIARGYKLEQDLTREIRLANQVIQEALSRK